MLDLFLEALGVLAFLLVAWVLLRQAAFSYKRRKWAREIKPGKGLGV